MDNQEKKRRRAYKRLLRERLLYFLDVVGLDHLDEEQQKEYNLLVRKLGASSRMMSFQFENDQTASFPVKVDFNRFTVEEYQRLKDQNYTLKEIQQMCGVSGTKLYHWRKLNGLVASREK
ncbi:hypothetical protein [Enterococcus faecalis]|uniref:hypothetical protein n=1 Tax=Enterococcus faecalis TaxID=1351 RepID=UPI001A96C280|nr:hypothetical protein [Enterococcus faecalis]MBO1137177.1 hypothetical protein [Enterococcus faecalis]